MERDDIIEYSLDAHHSNEHGKSIRAKIWKVTAILTLITAVEVVTGIIIKQDHGMWELVKWFFIGLTIVKAAYIVMVFMHLGDENKVLRYFILVPYFIFILYLIFICLVEAVKIDEILKTYMGF